MARQLGEDKSRDMASSSTGFCYSDVSSGIQGFVSDSEMFNLTSGMEMIGFSKNLHLHQQQQQQENLIQDSSSPWHQENRFLVDDSSLRCVFPCEGNERPSQGLSLSLSSTNPSSIGLQPFELRHTNHHHLQQQQQQQKMLQDGYFSTRAANIHNQQGHFVLKNSKFLVPAQDLLNELCSLGTKQNDVPKPKSEKNNQWEEGSSKKHCLGSLEFVELQKRKTKLFSMLEEVDRRYRHYCNQMKAVVSSFEAVAGNGAATVYSALALKAMSKHFRCLKDGILEQIHATRKVLGEKDPISPGTTKGETPRLRIIEQSLRQQRAFQQMNMMETHPWRPQRGLPERSVSILRAWLFEHFLHPYPSDVDKHILARQTGLSRSQVSNWFINARVRLWKPMVEEMYLEEEKEREQNIASSEGGANNIHEEEEINHDVQNQNLSPSTRPEDQKPTQARLLRIDSECMSSIINNPDHENDTKSHKTIHHMNPHEQFESIDLDFSSYGTTHHSPSMVSFTGNDHHRASQGFHGGGGGGGVSLTLGLQQLGGNSGGGGVSLAFPPLQATQGSMFFMRDQIDEECPPVQYSLLDNGEGQNMTYRNLMGTQLLHDFA